MQGIRHIRSNKQTHDLKIGRRIEKASANTHQLVVSLAGGELVYFELDAAGVLTEMGTQDMGKEVRESWHERVLIFFILLPVV